MPLKHIASRQNALVARYRSVARGDVKDAMLLDGVHLIQEALSSGVTLVHAVAALEELDRPDVNALIREFDDRRLDAASASSTVMAAISPVRSSSMAVAVAERPPDRGPSTYPPGSLMIVACDIQDPGNLGAVVRAAEATGTAGLMAAGACADPFGWKALRGSMGSAFRLPIAIRRSTADALLEIRQAGFRLVAALPQGGEAPATIDLTGPVAVMIGGEGGGLSSEAVTGADARISVPMKPPVESLNTAVAAAVILYEAARQRGELKRQ